MRATVAVMIALAGAAPASNVHAAAFGGLRYDAQRDELVVTIDYRGTNPDHSFTLQWGPCRSTASARGGHEIAAEMIDSQWDDHAQREYQKVVRFDLADMHCRPAELTLRTAPGFHGTIFVPARARSS